jgi:adenylate cyclase
LWRWAGTRSLALALLAGLLALRAWDPIPVETVRLRVFDIYQELSPRAAKSYPAIIVDIDEKSLARFGQWPWPRSLLAELVDRLKAAGVAAIAFDAVFAEPDRLAPENLARELRGLPPDAAEALRALPGGDAVFAAALARAPSVLGRAALAIGQEGPPRSGPAPAAPVAELGGDPKPSLLQFGALVRNRDELERAARGAGVFSLPPERDNIVRRVPAAIVVDGRVYPALAIEMLRIATGQGAFAIRSNAAGIDSVVVAGVRIPTDERGRIWLHFADPNPARYVSVADVMAGAVEPGRLARRLAILGTSAAALGDIKATAAGRPMPGVEVHIQLLEMILAGTHLTRPNYALGAELAMLVIAGLVVIVLLPMAGAKWALGVAVAEVAALAGASWHLFAAEGLLFDVTYPAVAAFALYSLLTFLAYVREEAERRRVRTAFSRYLSPTLVARLAEDPSRLRLGGEDREMTLMFTDVKGFTRIAETYDATSLTALINRMLTPLTSAILEHAGTVDKYMGDAIMAFWNAPLDDPRHAANACRAALEVQRRMGPVNEAIKADCAAAGRVYMPLEVGVGLNTGVCCVGNMGSDLRFDYSVLGDTVNIAARLEGQTRTYHVDIVVGETTRDAAPELAFLEIDLIRVVGKAKPVRIYALLGEEALAADPKFRALAEAHDAMLAAYRAQDWRAARAALERVRPLDPGLGLGSFYDLYEARLDEYETAPPERDWDAVYVATAKH